MKKQLRNIFALLTIGASLTATAQNRYDDPIYTNAQITITPDVTYGTNQAISLTGGAPAAQVLRMDVYQPSQSVDLTANRPLILVLHTEISYHQLSMVLQQAHVKIQLLCRRVWNLQKEDTLLLRLPIV